MIGLVLLFISGIGFIFTAVAIAIIVRSARTRNWLQTVGTLVSADVRQQEFTGKNGTKSITYYPYINYEYSVGGILFKNDEISASLISGYHDFLSAQKALEQYPIGKQVVVTYNPENPKKSVLIVGGSIANWILLVVGVSVLVGGLLGLSRQ